MLLITVPTSVVASEKIDLSDVRRVYKDVRAAITHAQLHKRERRFDYCEPYQDASRTIYASVSGVPRLYEHQAGSDDSAITWAFYYDSQARLRFVFITGGAVNGTSIEHRMWFAEDGRRLKEEHKLVNGPGYTFPDYWADEDIVWKPEEAFSAPNPCKELSGQ